MTLPGERKGEGGRGYCILCKSRVSNQGRNSLLPALTDVVVIVGVPGTLAVDDLQLLSCVYEAPHGVDPAGEQDVEFAQPMGGSHLVFHHL